MEGGPPSADLASSFHTVGRVLQNKKSRILVTADPDEPVREALERMVEGRFSQVPVVHDGQRIGIFSLWSLARHLVAFPQTNIRDLRVENALADLPEIHPQTSLLQAATQLRMDDAVFVSSDDGGIDVLTDEDLLIYFHMQSRPFIIIQEIEMALRKLIDANLDEDEIRDCLRDSMQGKYAQAAPSQTEDLEFSDYQCLLSVYWDRFEPILREDKRIVLQRLQLVRKWRNAALHFRAGLDDTTLLIVRDQRDWLHRKLRRARIPVPEESQENVVVE